jgi:hypothetical protein
MGGSAEFTAAGLRGVLANLGGVAVKIPNRRIDLRQSDFHRLGIG